MTTTEARRPGGPAGQDGGDELDGLLAGLSARDRAALAAMIRPALRARAASGDRAALDTVAVAHRALNDPQGMAGSAEMQGAVTPAVLPARKGRSAVELPSRQPALSHPLDEVLEARASRRDFSGGAIDLPALAALLERSYGVRGTTAAYNSSSFPTRYAPSAGGVQSVDLYVIANDVADTPCGAHLYAPAERELRLVNSGDMRRTVVECSVGAEWVYSAAAVLVLVGVLDRGRWKYGDRAYCFAHFDAGFVGQNLYLAATSLGLRTSALAGFDHDRIARLLGVDGRTEIPLLLVPVGTRAPRE